MNRINLLLSIALLLVLEINCYGQQNKKQQEKKESYSKFKDSNSPSELLQDARSLKDSNTAEALNKVKEALGISLAQNDQFNEARCYILLGEINEGIQEWKLAAENYSNAYILLLNSNSLTTEFKKTLQGLGNTNLKLNRFEASLKYYQEKLQLRLNSEEKNEGYLEISEVHYQMTNYPEALKMLDNVITGKVSNTSFQTRLQNQKAKIFARMNDLEKTKDLYQSSVNTLRSAKTVSPEEKLSMENTKEEISDVLRGQNRYDEEIDIRNQSIQFNLENNNLTQVSKDKIELSKTFTAKGENSEALKQLEEAAVISDSSNNPKQQAHAYLALAVMYEFNQKQNQALSAYKKYSRAVIRSEALNETVLTEKSNLIKKQKDIEELTKDVSIGQREETIARGTLMRQQLIIYGLLAIILIIAITSYFIYKNARKSKIANQLLALKSLRSQMNPHFIFNALNSVNHFVSQQDERTANKFLSEFSQLMRLVLENSQEDFIPLQKEHEILSLYLKLEHYRFRDRFDYEIVIDEELNAETVQIPPMLIQPYIENAVWHGIRYKESKGKLTLNFIRQANELVVEIKDDGIGRKKSEALKTPNQKKHNSTGLRNIQERLTIINKVYKTNYRVFIEDLPDETGTYVKIYLPFL